MQISFESWFHYLLLATFSICFNVSNMIRINRIQYDIAWVRVCINWWTWLLTLLMSFISKQSTTFFNEWNVALTCSIFHLSFSETKKKIIIHSNNKQLMEMQHCNYIWILNKPLSLVHIDTPYMNLRTSTVLPSHLECGSVVYSPIWCLRRFHRNR